MNYCFFGMDPPNEERNVAKRKSSSDVQELNILTPEKKARIDAEESKIMEISDLPDFKSGMMISRKALKDSKSLEAENLLLKQKIEELESQVNIRTKPK